MYFPSCLQSWFDADNQLYLLRFPVVNQRKLMLPRLQKPIDVLRSGSLSSSKTASLLGGLLDKIGGDKVSSFCVNDVNKALEEQRAAFQTKINKLNQKIGELEFQQYD